MDTDGRRGISADEVQAELAAAEELDDEGRLAVLEDLHARLESRLDEGVEPTDAA